MVKIKQIIVLSFLFIAAAGITSCNNPNDTDDPDNPGLINPVNPAGSTYKVTVQPMENGEIKLDKIDGLYLENELVVMRIEPYDGYECISMSAVITDTKTASISGILTSPNRSFLMPDANVFIQAGFSAEKALNSITKGAQVYGSIVSISPEAAPMGTVVTVTLQPDNARYLLDGGDLRIVGYNSGTLTASQKANKLNTYTFNMPDEPVTLHAQFFDPAVEQFLITVNAAAGAGGNSLITKRAAAAGETVTIAAYPKDDYAFSGTPNVATSKGVNLTVTQGAKPLQWTFTMPAAGLVTGDSIIISGGTWTQVPMYTVTAQASADSHGMGKFIINGLNRSKKAAPGGEVQLTLKIIDPDNFFYRQNSIKAVRQSGGDVTSALSSVEKDVVWKLTLPIAAPSGMVETVAVTAMIEGFPAYPVTLAGINDNGKRAGVITIAPQAVGKDIGAGELKVRQGKPVTAILWYDDEDYAFTEGSFQASGVNATAEGSTKLKFTMPSAPVTLSAVLTATPNIPITIQPDPLGTVKLTISSATGVKANARQGYAVSIAAAPIAGYKGVDSGPVLTPAQPLTKNENSWKFTMPGVPVTIHWPFQERGHVEIFKGSPKIDGLSFVAGAWPYFDAALNKPMYLFADWSENTNGRNGGAAIKVGPNSKTTGMNYSGEVGFGLSAPMMVDAGWAGAISFWMRRESGAGNLGTAFMGFGESEMAVWFGDANNQNIPITNEWQRYIVPVPRPKDNMSMKRVFFWKGNANAVWLIDDIEFIPKSNVELTNITIPAKYTSQIEPGAQVEAYTLAAFDKLSFTYKTTAGAGVQASATMHNTTPAAPQYNWAGWVPKKDYTFRVYGSDASLAGSVITPVKSGGSFELTMLLDQVESNRMLIEIENDNLKFLENFENGNIRDFRDGRMGYWDRMLWRECSTQDKHGGSYSGVYKYVKNKTDPWWTANPNGELGNQETLPRGGRNFPAAVDVSKYTKLSFWIKANYNGIESDTVSFMLSNNAKYSGAGGTYVNDNLGNLVSVDFTISGSSRPTENGFKKIEIPLASFSSKGLDLTKVTGWSFQVKTFAGCTSTQGNGGGIAYEYQFNLDDIVVEK